MREPRFGLPSAGAGGHVRRRIHGGVGHGPLVLVRISADTARKVVWIEPRRIRGVSALRKDESWCLHLSELSI